MITEEQSNTNVQQTENWAEGWVKKDRINPSPFSQEAVVPDVSEITDEQLDNAIDIVLQSPEVSAMIENAASDAADDATKGAWDFDAIKRGQVTEKAVSQSEFNTFKARVEAAFKHAGFKF